MGGLAGPSDRRPESEGRAGSLGRRRRAWLLAAGLAASVFAGCASPPEPGHGEGTWHVVQPGETVWRISQRHGVAVDDVIRANAIEDVRSLAVGQRLWIPGGRGGVALGPPPTNGAAPSCEEASREALAFGWPVLGRVTSPYGARNGRRHDGVDLAAPKGAPVRAAEAGRVVYSGALRAYGNVVIVKHQGHWATVYAHNRRNLAGDGAFVEKGDVIAEVGRTGNASAPHLHFEIRRSNASLDPIACLP